MKISDLITWLQTKQGGNLFNNIPTTAGIYKIYVLDADKSNIKFVKGKTLTDKPMAKNTSDIEVLRQIYQMNLEYELNEYKHVLYIGKANYLRKRIAQYVRTVFGGKSRMGGIDIWAVDDYKKYLNIEWFELSGSGFATAREWEKDEIAKFKKIHGGNRPLANRQN